MQYTWAVCTVLEPGHGIPLLESDLWVMAPFADFLTIRLLSTFTIRMINQITDTLHFMAGSDFEEGDQVFINYGPIKNSRLAWLWFTLPNNPNNSYDLILTTHSLAAVGLNITSTIPLTLMDPFLDKVLQYLCIQHLTDTELRMIANNTDTAQPVTARNKSEVIDDAFTSLLEGFPVSANKLQWQIDQVCVYGGCESWVVALVSIEEQQVLEASLA
ncbi:hypothetical protein BC937DRAFT_94919 [Endogone sp. FLAS-F59071]|nr:hypothetical protein BC937DRAFT_94919 [Endogone sp. FLAS-F59071]|eukprot:RUS22922.1 hypothetical protein BC937DRAFT_94919 [Endogone sp. FLAS-F59071]